MVNVKEVGLSIEEVSKSYDHQVLDEISFEISVGEIMGLIGPNGAGKTTLARIIIGHTRTDSGSVWVRGEEVGRNPAKTRRYLGISFEDPVFNTHLNAFDYLMWVGQVRGLSHEEASEQARFWFEFYEMEDSCHKLLTTYSAGMRQKFSIAQALVGYPDIVILDEPTSNLDVSSRLKTLEMIKEISLRRKTSFLVFSHALHDLGLVAHKIGFMRRGKIVLLDTTDNLESTCKPTHFLIHLNHSPEDFLETIRSIFDKLLTVVRVDSTNNIIDCILPPSTPTAFHERIQAADPGLSKSIVKIQPKYNLLEDLFLQINTEESEP